MGSHPLNLGLRFVLELCALASVASFGWVRFDGTLRWVLAAAGPLLFMVLWGTFAVPDDPSRSGAAPVPIPGALRLLLELVLFAAAAGSLIAIDQPKLGVAFALVVVLHYASSWDRIAWLLGRAP